MNGRVLWVLHAHLPFVRHPEHPRFFEEDWLFEAIERSYLPLLEVFQGWRADGVEARVAVSVSPPLLAMWQDRLLQERFRAHLDRRSALLAEERRRLRRDPTWAALAEMLSARVAAARALYERIGGDLVAAFGELERAGTVELMTTSATHALLPMYRAYPGFVRAQVRTGIVSHARAFGRPPLGFWLPECGWLDGIDEVLLEAGARYTLVEGHGLLYGRPTPACGLWRPVTTPNGLMVLGRDPDVARRIWSPHVGFPADPRYLDFHRDETAVLPEPYVRPYLLPSGARVPLGLRYRRVTSLDLPGDQKAPYEPDAARAAAEAHAQMFVAERARLLESAGAAIGWAACSVAPFDAELFGHWWHEGPDLLDRAARASAGRLDWVTGADFLAKEEPLEVIEVAPSTWGEQGDASAWVAPETAWMWPGLLDAVGALEEVRQAAPPAEALDRIVSGWAREVFLAASSDWPFLVHMKTAIAYAEARVRSHLERAAELERVARAALHGAPPPPVEVRDDIFPWLSYRTVAA